MAKAGKSQAKDASPKASPSAGTRARTTDDTTVRGHRWTFLTNHSHVLILLHREPGIVLREVALQVGITERAVQRIIQDLEEEGFIRREKVGRKNQYEVLTEQPLRHPIENHKTIGELLNLVAP
ncbi:MAG: winged helix-turn-helix domain-containing protein [Planctomyces sp.]|nr:winged helix-turn-helix domain-containing protein [Planctomyces sp.]